MSSQPEIKEDAAQEEPSLERAVERLSSEVCELYKQDDIPWVLGYSGGKDSTAIVQLVWSAIESLSEKERHKPIFVISTDTLVENPVVSAWVRKSLEQMTLAARKKRLPIIAKELTPEIQDTFWVNLIGKGYPAPRPKFRWCTERLKIKPVDNFVRKVVERNGEAIIVLGTRKAESSVRAARLNKLEGSTGRDLLSTHSSLENAFVYSPISNWSNDDVWVYLMQRPNPWDYSNKDLLTMYQGATEDGECPLVTDTTTPSCGSSRFGCWVCTLVTEDKSMTAMIRNDDEKSWMVPLLSLRNALDQHDHDKRDFRRLSGVVSLKSSVDELVPGPYTQTSREEWLRKLLSAQQAIREDAATPEFMREIELITRDELREIRRIWVVEKFEIEDRLPKIFEEETGESFGEERVDASQPFGPDEMVLLREEVCGGDTLKFQLLRELIEVERRFRSSTRRAGLFDRLEGAIKKGYFENSDEALEMAKSRRDRKKIVSDVDDREVDHSQFKEAISAAKQLLSSHGAV